MNRSQKVKEVYAELRHALGDTITSREAIKTAAFIVRMFDGSDSPKGASISEGRGTFDGLPVDRAISDGGWRVMYREKLWAQEDYSDPTQNFMVQDRLRNLGVGVAA